MQNLTNFSHRCQTLTANQMKKISGGDNSDYCEAILAIKAGAIDAGDTKKADKADELYGQHCGPGGTIA